MIKVIADSFIPFLQGRLEPYVEISYVHPDLITASAVRDADALLIRTRTRCGAPLLENSRVQFIATATIGMDQFDLPWCKEHGIATFNSPGCNAPGVAQYVWSSLLHLRINPHDITIGIVGAGNVGSIVAEWGRHLGARVLLCDPPKQRSGAAGEYVSLPELLAGSDVVSLHTPLTRDGADPTWHMIGERETALMRPGAILINAARGPVVDTAAVIKAAQRGSIRLITDTWEGEPDHLDPEQLRLSLIATPHIAGYSLQGKQRATRMIVENLARHFSLPLALSEGESGIRVWDLPEPYTPVKTITAHEIMSSYDPLADDLLLRRAPERFEWERDRYDYRSEPLTTRPAATQAPVAALIASDLEQGRVESFIKRIETLFKKFPCDWPLDMEHDFHRLLYSMLLLTGIEVEVERHSTAGRIDMLIGTARYIYVIELKRNRTAFEALDQIEYRRYENGLEPRGRRIIKVGINFSTATRTIQSWAVTD